MTDEPITSLETEFPDMEERIASWMEKIRFRKQIIGGLDEADVWTKIRELNDLYKSALAAERMRYDTLLAERTKGGVQRE